MKYQPALIFFLFEIQKLKEYTKRDVKKFGIGRRQLDSIAKIIKSQRI